MIIGLSRYNFNVLLFYVYMWLRDEDGTFPVGTPYYVGMGRGRRAFTKHKHRFYPPKGSNHILIMHVSDKDTAFKLESSLIASYGRIDVGTGCLRNLTDGGENPPSWKGRKHSEETLRKLRLLKQTLGHKLTAEHIGKLKLYKPGHSVSVETRDLIRSSKLGKPRLDMVGNTFRQGSVAWNKGLKHTEAHRRKLREAWVRRKIKKIAA